MRCEEIERRALEYLDGVLDVSLREAVEEHIRICASCREELRELRLAWGLLDLYEAPSPSEGFVEGTVASFRRLRVRERRASWIRRAVPAAAAALLIGLSLFLFDLPGTGGARRGPGEALLAGGGAGKVSGELGPSQERNLLENLDLIEDLDRALHLAFP